MKRALSRKNLWGALPSPLKSLAGGMLRAVPLPWLLGGSFRATLHEARAADRWAPEQIERYQVEKLRWIGTLAQQTPFYREHFAKAGFDPASLRHPHDLRKLPTIDKNTIREQGERLCVESPQGAGVDLVTTGGTGGVPLEFFINADRSAIEYAHLIASWERAGYAPGTPTAIFRGRVVEPDRNGLRHAYDPLLRHHSYSNFHMTDADMGRYLDHVSTIGSCFLHVYPSSAVELARYSQRADRAPLSNVRGLISESEILYPEQRELIEQVFGARVFSCYGHSEKLVLAAGCEHSDDYHVWPTYGYFELLDEDGNSVTTPGQRGEIVGTGFINRVMPFIRYRTGDQATFIGTRCDACGRAHTVLREIRGHRIQEGLVLADGTRVSWTAMNMHDDTFRNVRQFQFYQDTPGESVLRIVVADSYDESDERHMLRKLEEKLAGRLSLRVERVDAIDRTTRGKAVYVDQRIPEAGPVGAVDVAAAELR